MALIYPKCCSAAILVSNFNLDNAYTSGYLRIQTDINPSASPEHQPQLVPHCLFILHRHIPMGEQKGGVSVHSSWDPQSVQGGLCPRGCTTQRTRSRSQLPPLYTPGTQPSPWYLAHSTPHGFPLPRVRI